MLFLTECFLHKNMALNSKVFFVHGVGYYIFIS